MNNVSTVTTRASARIVRLMLTAMLFFASAVALADSDTDTDKVNLNTADAEALQYIPGIGASKAAKIISVREEIGGFRTMDDVLSVPGVGEKTMVEIKLHGVLSGGVNILTEEMQENPPKMSQESRKSDESDESDESNESKDDESH